MARVLDVYLYDTLAGKLSEDMFGYLSFTYGDAYCNQENMPALSVALPVQAEPFHGTAVKTYFSALLPDGKTREQLARCLNISDENVFDLLEKLGGECAGAVSFHPEGKIPPEKQATDALILDDQQLQEVFALLRQRPLLAGIDDMRISLSGHQSKLSISVLNNKIALVRGAAPTTHILKPMSTLLNDSAHNEFFCTRLAKAMKIDVPQTELRNFGNTSCLLIERYDRVCDPSGIIKRYHQENFCQALSTKEEDMHDRSRGPRVNDCLKLLQKYSTKPAMDGLAFIKRIIFNYLIGNAHAYGTKFSLLHKENDIILAPACGIFCTAVYPHLSTKMAMKIGDTHNYDSVSLEHWHSLMPNTIAAKRNIEKQLVQMSSECLEKAKTLKLKLQTAGIESPLFDVICHVIKTRGEHIQISMKGINV